MLYAVVAAAAAVLLTALLTRLARVAARTGAGAGAGAGAGRPPRLGGLAVAAGTLLVSCTGYADLGPGTERLLWAASALALLGLAGDLRPGRPLGGVRVRLAVTAGAALFFVYGTGLGVLAALAAAGWIVFVTHAFRWLDSSDGVLGTVGAVTALGLALCAAAEGRAGLALVLTVLAAALGGFLGHNWHPARIFLGDCGALFVGFLLAAAAVAVHVGHEALPSVAGLSVLTLAATADTALVLLSRRRAARPLLRPAADHIAHRLRRVGFTVPGAAVVLALLAFAGTLTAVLIHGGTAGPNAAAPLLLAVIGGTWALLRVPVYGGRSPGGAGRAGGVARAGGAGRVVGGTRRTERRAVRRPARAAARPGEGPRTLALRTPRSASGGRAVSASGARAASATGLRPASASGARPATASGSRPVSAAEARRVVAAEARVVPVAGAVPAAGAQPVPGTRRSGTPAEGTRVPVGARSAVRAAGGRPVRVPPMPAYPAPGGRPDADAPPLTRDGTAGHRAAGSHAAGNRAAGGRSAAAPGRDGTASTARPGTPPSRTRRGLAALTRTVRGARRAEPGAPTASTASADLARG